VKIYTACPHVKKELLPVIGRLQRQHKGLAPDREAAAGFADAVLLHSDQKVCFDLSQADVSHKKAPAIVSSTPPTRV